jgi:ubiquinone/menaquinone biosynthesis C-methylase UbiE
MINQEKYYQKIKKLNIEHYAAEVPYYTKAPLRKVEITLLKTLPKGSKILDLGCGAGRFSIGAARMGFNVTAVDITPASIRNAKQRAIKNKLKNVNFLVGDMTNLDFRDSVFDYVFCPRFSINAVATYEKREQAIKEMFRVVKPDGKVFIESFNKLYLGRGPILVIQNIVTDLKRCIQILIMNTSYEGELPGDIIYDANKVIGAPKGYAHLPTIYELKSLTSSFDRRSYSIKNIVDQVKFDLLKYFRYSIWIIIKK